MRIDAEGHAGRAGNSQMLLGAKLTQMFPFARLDFHRDTERPPVFPALIAPVWGFI